MLMSLGTRTGSSPRVRGTEQERLVDMLIPRFIPARAGNSALWYSVTALHPVHPRECGEQFLRAYPRLGSVGSSPRVRGTGWRRLDSFRAARFIPARAGNRRSPGGAQGRASVHPRACGEQHVKCASMRRDAGSSPRVRGTVASGTSILRCRRFIPARAGNSSG